MDILMTILSLSYLPSTRATEIPKNQIFHNTPSHHGFVKELVFKHRESIKCIYWKDKDFFEYTYMENGEVHGIMVHSTSEVGTDIKLEGRSMIRKGCKIGNNFKIHHRVIIDEGCTIHNNVTLGKEVSLGANCKIFDNVVVHENCIIANNVTIKEFAEIHKKVYLGVDVLIEEGVKVYADVSGVSVIKTSQIEKSNQLPAAINFCQPTFMNMKNTSPKVQFPDTYTPKKFAQETEREWQSELNPNRIKETNTSDHWNIMNTSINETNTNNCYIEFEIDDINVIIKCVQNGVLQVRTECIKQRFGVLEITNKTSDGITITIKCHSAIERVKSCVFRINILERSLYFVDNKGVPKDLRLITHNKIETRPNDEIYGDWLVQLFMVKDNDMVLEIALFYGKKQCY